MAISIGRPAAGNVEHRAGRERAVFRRQPCHHRREFFDQDEARLRNLRQHEVDVLLRHLVEDRGLRRRRRHRVDEDVVLREFLAERFCQRDQAGLRGRVMRGVGVAFLAGDGGDVDDAAVLLLQHRRHHRLAADEGPVEIDAQHLAPFLEVGFPHRLVDAGDAGIVDEDVDLAERLQRLVTRLLDRGEIRHVDLEGRYRRADFLRGLFRKRQVVIPDRDLRARCDEALGDRAAKALRAAGDDGAAAVQIDLVHVVPL